MTGPQPVQAQRQQSLPLRLGRLQVEGRLAAPPFAAVPPSGQRPIEGVLDEAGDLKSTILLGFTRDGGHLVSYTTQPVAAADGQEGYCMQLWRYQPGERCRRLWSVPLFRTPSYLESLADEEDFMAADDILLTVAEVPDSSLLVVHGRSTDPADAASRDHHLANYLSLIPGPVHAGSAQLQVAHLSYHTTYPHAPFNPYLFLTPLEGSSSSSSSSGNNVGLAVALYGGDGVRYVHVAISRQAVRPAAAGAGTGQLPHTPTETTDDEMDSSTSLFPSPEPSRSSTPPVPAAGQRSPVQPATASQAGGDQQQQYWQQQQHHQGTPTRSSWPASASQRSSSSPRGSPWPQHRRRQRQQQPHQVQRLSPAGDGLPCGMEAHHSLVNCSHAGLPSSWQLPDGSLTSSGSGGCHALAAASLQVAPQQLDLETCIYAALQQQGVPPAALLDYAAAPVLACSWGEQDGLLLLGVLRLARQPSEASPQQQRQQQACSQPQPQHRSACVLLHVAASSGVGAVVEWLEPPYPWHHDLSAFLVQQTAFAGVAFEKAPAFFADFMRSRYAVPPPRHCLPFTLSNRSVLGSGQSLQHIAHPWLPIAIMGYRQGAAV